VAGARRLRILSILAADGGAAVSPGRLCVVGAQVAGVTGAGVMLMSGDVPRGSVCTSDAVGASLEHLQDALGEGPGVDAFTTDRPVAEADLAFPRVPRWPAFSGPAVAAGARAVFGFPLQVGAVRLGALNLHRDRPGPLSDEEHADALVMAQLAAETVLVMQAQAPSGQLPVQLEASADFQYVVHQAAGMVAAQLDTTVGRALLRLRAHAFGNEQPLVEVAKAVVDRSLRFSPEPGEADAATQGGPDV
jgi:hypothetical protein